MARSRDVFALLVGSSLLACSALSLRDSFLFVSVARSNVCNWYESTNCFEREPGVVHGDNGKDEMTVTSLDGETEDVGSYNGGWDELPAPDTKVVLERWEGDEIAYVYVPGNGSRYKTRGAPDRENPVVVALILAFLAVALPLDIIQRPARTKRR